MSDVRIVVAGASGRMGRTLIRTIAETPGCVLAGCLEAPGHPHLGEDGGTLAGLAPLGVNLTANALPVLASAQALIDFTVPRVSVDLAAMAAQARITHVIGTTGLTAEGEAKIQAAARHAVIVKSSNMS